MIVLPKICCITLLLFCLQSSLLAKEAADSTGHIPFLRIEADIGAELFGFRGSLYDHYGMPASFCVGARIGQEWGKWTAGIRISQVDLGNEAFAAEYFHNGRLQAVDVSVYQRNTLFAFDVRRDFGNHRHFYPFVDAGIAAHRMLTRLCITDPSLDQDDDDAYIDTRDINVQNKALFSLGAGVRLKLDWLFMAQSARPIELKEYAFLELRVGYALGGETTFVNTAVDPNLPITPPRTSHSLYQRPIVTSPADAFFVRMTLGFRINR